MFKSSFSFALIVCFLSSFLGLIDDLPAQTGVKAFGIQYKPIFPLALVNTDGQSVSDVANGTSLSIEQRFGYNVGATIRFGISKRFSIETGINYVQRNYHFVLNGNSFPESRASLEYIGYEVPIVLMVFVQLDRKVFMNVAAGHSYDFFPTGGVVNYDRDSIEFGVLETNWIQTSLMANLGFEYRSENNGIFYLGASYHRPLGNMAEVYVSYRKPNTTEFVQLVEPPPQLNGNYLTIDLRYYFNPGKTKQKKE